MSRLPPHLRTGAQGVLMLLVALLLAIGAAMLTGCGVKVSAEPSTGYIAHGVRVVHDDERGVTCWLYKGYHAGGISCLPDYQLASDEPEPDYRYDLHHCSRTAEGCEL